MGHTQGKYCIEVWDWFSNWIQDFWLRNQDHHQLDEQFSQYNLDISKTYNHIAKAFLRKFVKILTTSSYHKTKQSQQNRLETKQNKRDKVKNPIKQIDRSLSALRPFTVALWSAYRRIFGHQSLVPCTKVFFKPLWLYLRMIRLYSVIFSFRGKSFQALPEY